jgi:phosphoadenosine phosphosulfate reductase
MSAIALYARKGPEYDARVAKALAVLLGAEDMVITDLIARHAVPISLGTLETGMLHPQTSALIPRIEERYGLKVEVYRPVNEAVVQFVKTNGEKAMYESLELRKACCGIRKMEPLGRMMEGRSAWVTGLRREQSNARGEVSFSEVDDKGRTKFSPLADWTWADVWQYISANAVPYNPLHDEFMPSIGCAPCTRAIAVGEDFRSGRWWWEDEKAKECGLHVKDTTQEQPVASMIGTRA